MLLEISLGALGMGSVRAGEMPHGVIYSQAGGPGKIDRREASRKAIDPRFEEISGWRPQEQFPIRLYDREGLFGAGKRYHHPVAMELQLIGYEVDPLNVFRRQEIHTIVIVSRHSRVVRARGVP